MRGCLRGAPLALLLLHAARAAVPDAVDGLGKEQGLRATPLEQTIGKYCAPHPQDGARGLQGPWPDRVMAIGGMRNPTAEQLAAQEEGKGVPPETICTQTSESLALRSGDGTDGGGRASWDIGPSLTHSRCLHASVALRRGGVLVFGGTNGKDCLPSVEAFQPAAFPNWTRRPSLRTARSGLAGAVLDERAYALGGSSLGLKNVSASVESWADGEDAWRLEAPMPQPLFKHSATAGADGRIYVTGGRNSSTLQDAVYSYDPLKQEWRTETPMSKARMAHASVHAEGRIYVLGGYVGVDTSGDAILPVRLSSVESYNPLDGRWREEASMPCARSGHAAVYHNGTIYVLGGCLGVESSRSTLVESLDIAGGAWRTEAPMNMERLSFSAVLMPEY